VRSPVSQHGQPPLTGRAIRPKPQPKPMATKMKRVPLSLVAAAIFVAGAVAARAGQALPDPKLTPGAIAETRTAVICVRGYARAHRVWHDKADTLAKYGLPLAAAGRYEDDDLVPVCLGGDNASPQNHWPQARAREWGAEVKDALEWRLCTEICPTRDDAALVRYQAAFAKDWIALDREVMASPSGGQ
jgi:hypothetical protein